MTQEHGKTEFFKWCRTRNNVKRLFCQQNIFCLENGLMSAIHYSHMTERQEKKGRKGTKSHKSIIFHLFVGKPPVNIF